MITVKLLGGSKRSFDSDKVSIDKQRIQVRDLLLFLKDSVQQGRPAFEPQNVLVAVNGTDSSALEGPGTVINDGDIVSIIPVVHGGSKKRVSFTVLNYNVEIIRTGKLADDPKQFLEGLRAKFPALKIQGIRSRFVLNERHAMRVVEISLSALKSGTLLSDKVETDTLMRFAASRQISEAIGRAGLRKGEESILVAVGRRSIIDKLVLEVGDSVKPVLPFPDNAAFIRKEFEITKKALGCVLSAHPLEDLLVERSAVLLR